MKHLPINQQVHPKHWISLCNQSDVQFTLDFNDADCAECVAVELDVVHDLQLEEEVFKRVLQPKSPLLKKLAEEQGRTVIDVHLPPKSDNPWEDFSLPNIVDE